MNAVSEFVNTEKIRHHYVIQYFHLNGLSPTKINAEQDYTLGKSARLFVTIKYRVAEFKRDRTTYQDEDHNDHPNEVTMPEMMKKIYKIVLDDRRIFVSLYNHY